MDKTDYYPHIAQLYYETTGQLFPSDEDHEIPTEDQVNMLKAALAYRLTADQYYVVVTHFGLDYGMKIDLDVIDMRFGRAWETYSAAMNKLGRDPLPPFPITDIRGDSPKTLDPNASVRQLGLCSRVVNTLIRAGMKTIGDLTSTPGDFYCRGLGKKGATDLKDAMAKAGYPDFTPIS